jgi:hypothetical protein
MKTFAVIVSIVLTFSNAAHAELKPTGHGGKGVSPSWTLVHPNPEFDCNYNDMVGPEMGPTLGSAIPSPERCPRNLGYVSVCWDGTKHMNGSNSKKDSKMPWCTYKTLSPDQCRALGPGTTGLVYVCQVPK